jgi:glycosyltransferase involved in cell wall biosynthesis
VAIIEAMAAGKAVVATSVGGVPDVIDDGRTGVLVPSRDVEALAGALTMLAKDCVARRRMGQAARESVETRFTSARLVDDVVRLYTSALAEKRGLETAI